MPAAQAAADFSGWHLPVPAGDWLISRGPCGGGGLFTHRCGYYEDHCAVDLTPVAGSMQDTPVLAPQAGQVFFLGTRSDSGLTVMLQHDDGRASAMMHLSKVVVGLDQRVAQGQVLGYAGSSGSSTRPHLHFHVLPNTVVRDCLPLDGLDEIDLVHMTVRSHNLPWSALVLVDPPRRLPILLPLAVAGSGAPLVILPQRVVLGPSASVQLPIAIANDLLPAAGILFAGQRLSAVVTAATYTVFTLPLQAPAEAGEYHSLLQIPSAKTGGATTSIRVGFAVRQPPETSASSGFVPISPTFITPANYANLKSAPRLCWAEPAVAGQAPLQFRVMVAGPRAADSGWMSESCWQVPAAPHGIYFWKVFVRDGRGYMNRTNQRPYVFRLR